MKRLTLPFAVGMAAVLVAGTALTANAKPVYQENWTDSGSEVINDFCGDLTVLESFDIRGTVRATAHGRDGLTYFVENVHGTYSWKNLDTGKTFSNTFNTTSKDQKVTDNGDGTLTILVLATGSDKYYANGKLVLTNPGQVRFEILIDDGGTPQDPDDDEFLEFLGVVKGTTGRNDTEGRDFCDDVHLFTS
jgi:hypothetical protein